MKSVHTPVLLHETLSNLDIKKGNIYFDGTLGNGGHAKEACRRVGAQGTVVGVDLDEDALEQVRKDMGKCEARTHFVKASFVYFNIAP